MNAKSIRKDTIHRKEGKGIFQHVFSKKLSDKNQCKEQNGNRNLGGNYITIR